MLGPRGVLRELLDPVARKGKRFAALAFGMLVLRASGEEEHGIREVINLLKDMQVIRAVFRGVLSCAAERTCVGCQLELAPG